MSHRIQTLLAHYPMLDVCLPDIQQAFDLLLSRVKSGNKLLLCGNGGSAADADHISGELLKGFQSGRPLPDGLREQLGRDLADHLQSPIAAIPLTAFSALSSAYLNDVSAEFTYAQLTLGLGKPGDVLWGLSTSGNAVNVGHALKVARVQGVHTLGLTGETGGAMRELCDVCIRVPSRETFRVQELHLPIYHCLCLMLEDAVFPGEATP